MALMYDSAETLEKLLNTIHCIHNFTSPNEKLFAGQQDTSLLQPIFTNRQGIQHYSINLIGLLKNFERKICFDI